jgi:hypothetical protein
MQTATAPIPRKPKYNRKVQLKAALKARYDSVREEREEWMKPFYSLPVDRAMAYLEDLRKICESAGTIMNERISKDTRNMLCACGCGKDLSGLKPNGLPKWCKKMDLKDKKHPEIWHSLYFAEAICVEKYTRYQQASCKCGHVRSEHGVGSDQSCWNEGCPCERYKIADREALKPTGIIT